ncbi:MAG TPA: hypothetical protein VFY06_10645 [Verrucomicrobiae bacterium]|nr:hypothetical protein [Verrucomicrobiae bacterium]
MVSKQRIFIVAALAISLLGCARAGEPTAFELASKGDQYVGTQSKGKVVQIRSEKSIGTMTPDIWYVVYYDPDATFKSVQVKFGAGKEMEVTHPLRILEMATDQHDVLDKEKLKVDSDRALKIAMSQPLLRNLKLKASKLTLGHGDEGPVWTVELWAAKLKNPDDNADVGAVILSATDGKVIKADLHPNSVD